MKVIVLKDMRSFVASGQTLSCFFYYVTSVFLCNLRWFCSQQCWYRILALCSRLPWRMISCKQLKLVRNFLFFKKLGYLGSWQLLDRCCFPKAWEIRKVSCRFMYRCCGMAPLIYTSFDYLCSERTLLYGCWNMFRVWVLI